MANPWEAVAAALVFLGLAIGFGCLRGLQEIAREHRARAETWRKAGKLDKAHIEYPAALQRDSAA